MKVVPNSKGPCKEEELIKDEYPHAVVDALAGFFESDSVKGKWEWLGTDPATGDEYFFVDEPPMAFFVREEEKAITVFSIGHNPPKF